MNAPLLVTARFDDDAFAMLDGMRRRYFPAHLNKVPAHLSLFHNLPGEEERAILAEVAARCRPQSPLQLVPVKLRFLGRGVALAYESAELSRLHGELSRAFDRWLTPQDRQGFRAHVTIQNKVDPADARALRDALQHDMAPPVWVEGLMVWRYLGGPWQHVATCPFGAGRENDP